jgi:hypothetical protein
MLSVFTKCLYEQLRLHDDDRRLFVFDTEADISTGIHLLTHINVAQLEIDYKNNKYKIVRWFIYDYKDEWSSMPLRMKTRLGGCGAFLLDVIAGLYSNSILLAHNLSGYDSYHLINLFTDQCDYLFEPVISPINPMRPYNNINFSNFIVKQTKIITFNMPYLNMHFADTMLMLPGSLASLAKSMGIKEIKDYFPYSLPQIRDETAGKHTIYPINYWRGLPPRQYYITSSMKPDRVAKISNWYRQEKKKRRNELFITHRERAAYCKNDNLILAHIVGRASLKEYQKHKRYLFMSNRPTITSYTYQLFLDKYMDYGHVAIIPDHGYGKAKGSNIADRWE